MSESSTVLPKSRIKRAVQSDAVGESAVSNVFFRRLLGIKIEKTLKQLQHVYFAQSINGGPIKIGCAVDVEKRLKSLQVGSPTPLKLLGVLYGGGRKKENELHKRFATQRLEGEWFAVSGDLMEEIKKANMEVAA
jgi:hypothetical protein